MYDWVDRESKQLKFVTPVSLNTLNMVMQNRQAFYSEEEQLWCHIYKKHKPASMYTRLACWINGPLRVDNL